MNFWQFSVFIQGKNIAQKYDACHAVDIGYYVGYYKSKKPKSPDKLKVEIMGMDTSQPHEDKIDVEAFKAMEAKFEKQKKQSK